MNPISNTTLCAFLSTFIYSVSFAQSLGNPTSNSATDARSHTTATFLGDICPGVCTGPLLNNGIQGQKRIVEYNNEIIFTADDGVNGVELWKTDGTVAGTQMIKDLHPGPMGSNPTGMVPFNGEIYFLTLSSPAGFNIDLWKTDGTESGTVLVEAFPNSWSIVDGVHIGMRDHGGWLYITATMDLAQGTEVWKSDGVSPAFLPNEISATAGAEPKFFMPINGELLFVASESPGQVHLYRDNGTTYEIFKHDFFAYDYAYLNGKLYMAGSEYVSGYFEEIWETDGTTVGTVRISDINPGDLEGSQVQGFTVFQNSLYFRAYDGTSKGLYQFDGSNIQLILDDPSSRTGILVDHLVATSDLLFFSGYDSGNGIEPWISDGIFGGTTQILKDFEPGIGNSAISTHPAVFNDLVFLLIDTSTNGGELYVSDGTQRGTHMTHEFNLGPGSSGTKVFAAVGDDLLVVASDGVHGFELYRLQNNTWNLD